jgi:Na+/H+ antiporter NhaD/arsenite permease-like protein
MGILLAIDALEAVGILKLLATFLNETVNNSTAIATVIGIISAIIDNVPLVAATMGMYDRIAFPIDSSFWLLTAFTAGTGGSMLSIGSAAGVALMGIEKVDFITYLKKASLPAALGYAGGIIIYILII